MRTPISAFALLLACTLASWGQDGQANFTSTSTSSAGGMAAAQSPTPQYEQPEKLVGSLTDSFVYILAPNDLGANRSLMGWSVVPSMALAHGVGLQADFESLYMMGVYPGQSRFIVAAGPRFNLKPQSRFIPFVFAEGGEVRMEAQRSRVVDWNPVVKGGIGFQTKLSRHFGLTLVPGEYLGQYQDNGTWLHSFTARFGITFFLAKSAGPKA